MRGGQEHAGGTFHMHLRGATLNWDALSVGSSIKTALWARSVPLAGVCAPLLNTEFHGTSLGHCQNPLEATASLLIFPKPVSPKLAECPSASSPPHRKHKWETRALLH